MTKIKVRPTEHDAQPVVTGDTIEFGLTYEVRGSGQTMWVKFATVSKVKEGESADVAVRRVSKFVQDNISQQVKDLT